MALKKIALILLAVLLTACSGQPAATEITIVMKEFAYEPGSFTVKAGTPVTLTLVNEGAVEHDFVIEVIPVEDVEASGEGMGDHHMSGDHAEFDLHTSTAANATSTLTFTPTQPGTYQIICSVPGHKDAGMIGELIVE